MRCTWECHNTWITSHYHVLITVFHLCIQSSRWYGKIWPFYCNTNDSNNACKSNSVLCSTLTEPDYCNFVETVAFEWSNAIYMIVSRYMNNFSLPYSYYSISLFVNRAVYYLMKEGYWNANDSNYARLKVIQSYATLWLSQIRIIL